MNFIITLLGEAGEDGGEEGDMEVVQLQLSHLVLWGLGHEDPEHAHSPATFNPLCRL